MPNVKATSCIILHPIFLKGEESILIFRMKSQAPGVMMPEIGRSVVHKEGVSLISEYIENLKGSSF